MRTGERRFHILYTVSISVIRLLLFYLFFHGHFLVAMALAIFHVLVTDIFIPATYGSWRKNDVKFLELVIEISEAERLEAVLELERIRNAENS